MTTTYLYTDKWGYEHHAAPKLTAEVNRVTEALNADALRVEAAKKTLQGRVPADYRKGGNCGVLSVAICAGVDFATAWAACNMKKGSKGSTHTGQREGALKRLGVPFEAKYFHLTKGHGMAYRTRFITVKTFVRDWTVPGVTYQVTTSGHVVTVRDGIVIDQAGAREAAHHWTQNKRVIRVVKIL